MRERFYRLLEKSHIDVFIYLIITSVIFIVYWDLSVRKILGILISILGYVTWIVALYQLGPSFQIRPGAKKLVTSGIYLKIRHPIYFGAFIIQIGIIIYTIGNLISFLIIIHVILFVIGQLFRAKQEERMLYTKYKSKYLKYKKQTWF